jgi:hypothetical protein
MAGFAGVVLGIALLTALVLHVQGKAVSTSKQTVTHGVVAAVTHAPVLRVATAPRLAPTVQPILVNDPAATATATAAPVQRLAQALEPATATPTDSTVSSVPPTPSGSSGAWITLDNYTQTPGNWTVHMHGGGFAPGETVDLSAQGADSSTPASLAADSQGNLDGSVSLQIAPGTNGTLSLLAKGEQSDLQATAGIGVLPYTATLSLAPYAAWPGQSVDVSGQGYPPNVPVRLEVGGKVLQTVRTDGGGNLQIHAAFTVPYSSPAGHLEVTASSSVGHTGATQTLDVQALQPWAIASAYAVHVGDRVQFDAHGFAAGEPVKVYLGESYLGQSSSPTDGQGNAGGIGPFVVPSDDPQPSFTLVGARSGAQVAVTLTVVP